MLPAWRSDSEVETLNLCLVLFSGRCHRYAAVRQQIYPGSQLLCLLVQIGQIVDPLQDGQLTHRHRYLINPALPVRCNGIEADLQRSLTVTSRPGTCFCHLVLQLDLLLFKIIQFAQVPLQPVNDLSSDKIRQLHRLIVSIQTCVAIGVEGRYGPVQLFLTERNLLLPISQPVYRLFTIAPFHQLISKLRKGVTVVCEHPSDVLVKVDIRIVPLLKPELLQTIDVNLRVQVTEAAGISPFRNHAIGFSFILEEGVKFQQTL